jgi:DNA-binding NtrC family response regulator
MEKQYDLCIVDCNHRNKSELDFIKILKNLYPKLPIVTLSDDTSVEWTRKMAELGVFYCAIKPVQLVEFEQIMQGIESLIKRRNRVENTRRGQEVYY